MTRIVRYLGSIAYLLILLLPCAGGSEWAKVTVPALQYNQIVTVGTNAFAAGTASSSGAILKSSNYGATWTTVRSQLSGFATIAARTLSNGVTYYIAVDNTRTVYVSSGTGESWASIASKPGNTVFGTAIGINGMAFMVGNGRTNIRSSSNASAYATWTSLTTAAGVWNWMDVSTLDGVNVIAVTSIGGIHYSFNSGSTWTAAASSGTSGFIYCVSHVSSTIAMAAGASGYIAKTSDGGVTWTTMTAFSNSNGAKFHDISMVSSTEAYVAASPDDGIASLGVIYGTSDGGSTWTLLATTDLQLYSLAMFSSTYGMAGTSSGSVIYALVACKLSLFIAFIFHALILHQLLPVSHLNNHLDSLLVSRLGNQLRGLRLRRPDSQRDSRPLSPPADHQGNPAGDRPVSQAFSQADNRPSARLPGLRLNQVLSLLLSLC